ncbi:alpha/beta hydrolase family protein [Glaciecola sp. 1036]|uniref:alpha/beta hydrolase family protein n=1 Tax=Alteromonadaceae TaxID=72275 RepID=UPI003D08E433
MKKLIAICALLLSWHLQAQVALDYQTPPEEINNLVDVKLAPATLIDDKREYMVLLYRNTYKSIAELSEKEMRLAGLRINPKTNIGSRVTFYNDVQIQKVGESKAIDVKGLPETPRLTNFRWSPDQRYIALTNTTSTGTELWLLDIHNAKAKRLLKQADINANMGDTINWFADSKALLVKRIPAKKQGLIDTAESVPQGPTISVSDGKKAQNRTYQDLLKNKDDEFNFEQLALSELHRVTLKGKSSKWLDVGMYGDVSVSPDGEYVLVTQYKKPFSYLVPYRRFPHDINAYTKNAKMVSTIESVPLLEDLPKGFMATRQGKRNIQWRQDMPATLAYAVALDEGDPEKQVDYRDEFFILEAPFNQAPTSLFKTINRFYSVTWGNDNNAIAYDYWWNTRNTKTYWFDPSTPETPVKVINDRNYQDRYSDPGNFVTSPNNFGRDVLAMKDENLFLLGDGYSEKGQFPFVDKFNLDSGETTRLYQSSYSDKIENLNDFDVENQQLLVRIESKNEYPNYYFRNLEKGTLVQLTDFENPFESLESVKKEVISYQREDGLDLSATLYLPLDYEEGKRYPMILWAYPREYKDKSSAGQNTQNPNEFTYPFWGSPIYWVTRGYVVLDDASFPIVGEGDEEPNDSFRTQLVANAKAAIDTLDQRGIIDPERVAVGGHSYGAFMVANLLSHSDLFAAGIARSGAYNRTLTPFGFQSEERTYWEAPEVYYSMSPFMHADKMKTPLLLIHGEADNNSGTYPLQSERYFNALKGLGATARLVMLPKESHGYRAKESILHLLWEQDAWLEKYVKNKDKKDD